MKSGGVERRLTARPDSVDFRDLMYVPTLVEVPPEKPLANYQALGIPVLDQGSEGACTGFGLATLANFLLATRKSQPDSESVSPHMAYSLARRYDEWAGEDAIFTDDDFSASAFDFSSNIKLSVLTP
jgi:hypothetical protein